MQDDYIWNMVAFLQQLPRMDAPQYQALVDSSGGHEHGGSETKAHGHAEGAAGDNNASVASTLSAAASPETIEHRHADGTIESHPVPPTQPQPETVGDSHDHQH